MSFLRKVAINGYSMGEVYSALQKSMRKGDINSALYWGCVLGVEYPNALKKRLIQNSLEDVASWELASKIMSETGSDKKANLIELLPWLVCICKMGKNHISAWLNRVAASHIADFNNFDCNNYQDCEELEFSVYVLVARNNKNDLWLKNACEIDSKLAYKMYKFINEDSLVYHVWQLNKRRIELKENRIIIDKNEKFDVDEILKNKMVYPEDWYDKHTSRGKKMGRGYEHFFSILELNPKMMLDNDYEEEAKLLCLNLEFGKELRSRNVVKEKIEVCIEKKYNKYVDSELFDVVDEKTLGFKNVTIIAILKQDISKEFCAGMRVYIKMGESLHNFEFAAIFCKNMRKKLGLHWLESMLCYVMPTYNYESYARNVKDCWGDSLKKKLNCALKKYALTDGYLPCMITGVFEGCKLVNGMCYVKDYLNVLKCLLYRKYWGISDSNNSNIMIDVNGIIYSVDENPCSCEQLEKMKGKGLFTAQKFSKDFEKKLTDCLWKNGIVISEFILELKKEKSSNILLKNIQEESFPFDDESIKKIRNSINIVHTVN